MPEKATVERSRKLAREGKSPSTQAGEFVREEIRHVRQGKHGARSPQQAVAIGLSKARRSGVALPPRKGTPQRTQEQAARDYRKGQRKPGARPSPRRSRAVSGALKREGKHAGSSRALSSQARSSARNRGPSARRQAAQKAIRTKGKQGLQRAARKAAETRKSQAA
jgi:hypothetical protein